MKGNKSKGGLKIDTKYYSKIGRYHQRRNEENQDYTFKDENQRFYLIALADGASACSESALGAKIACNTVKDYLFLVGSEIFDWNESKIAFLINEQVFSKIKKYAETMDKPVDQFGSTLAFCFIDKMLHRVLMFNLGDGAIFLKKDHQYSLISPPRNFGVNVSCLTTTEEAYKYTQVKIISAWVDVSFFICSDGFHHLLKGHKYSEAIQNAMLQNDYPLICKLIDRIEIEDDCSFILNTLEPISTLEATCE
ncbi:protein phosphatase 2C domain-containing protein [Fusibacter paucivorans]|uniref:Protein phosphatase 2C domain-containing protein n=1 Tax=Fusibacter paucivorans TaxID=76009 RepID=A0ABS5PT73_9FIRM|nr:protein phosphatase 2C domain-containing protein [Fusibacter paucivorans]